MTIKVLAMIGNPAPINVAEHRNGKSPVGKALMQKAAVAECQSAHHCVAEIVIIAKDQSAQVVPVKKALFLVVFVVTHVYLADPYLVCESFVGVLL
jgi:hypothetical protein